MNLAIILFGLAGAPLFILIGSLFNLYRGESEYPILDGIGAVTCVLWLVFLVHLFNL